MKPKTSKYFDKVIRQVVRQVILIHQVVRQVILSAQKKTKQKQNLTFRSELYMKLNKKKNKFF